MTTQLRRVGEVAKVPVFQYRTPNINYDPNGNPLIQIDKPFSDGPHELTFAYTPGLFVVGTSKASIGHAIRRFLGEEKAGGLGGTAAFREAARVHRQSGLFFYLNYPSSTLASKPRFAPGKCRGEPAAACTPLRGGLSDLYEWFNLTANAKAVKTVAGSVRFRDGGLAATVAVTLDPSHKSPLLDILSGLE